MPSCGTPAVRKSAGTCATCALAAILVADAAHAAQPPARVLVSPRADDVTKFAAGELASHLERACGVAPTVGVAVPAGGCSPSAWRLSQVP